MTEAQNDFDKFMNATDKGYLPRLSISDGKPRNIVFLGGRFEMVDYKKGAGEEPSMIYTVYEADEKKLMQWTSGSRDVATNLAMAPQGAKVIVQMTKQGLKSKINVSLVGTVEPEILVGLLDKLKEDYPDEYAKLPINPDVDNPLMTP